jgi:hypothetical protein
VRAKQCEGGGQRRWYIERDRGAMLAMAVDERVRGRGGGCCRAVVESVVEETPERFIFQARTAFMAKVPLHYCCCKLQRSSDSLYDAALRSIIITGRLTRLHSRRLCSRR